MEHSLSRDMDDGLPVQLVLSHVHSYPAAGRWAVQYSTQRLWCPLAAGTELILSGLVAGAAVLELNTSNGRKVLERNVIPLRIHWCPGKIANIGCDTLRGL